MLPSALGLGNPSHHCPMLPIIQVYRDHSGPRHGTEQNTQNFFLRIFFYPNKVCPKTRNVTNFLKTRVDKIYPEIKTYEITEIFVLKIRNHCFASTPFVAVIK
jgi:hypothetical protein